MLDFSRYTPRRIEQSRLALEPLCATHADELFAPLSDPALYTYIPQDPPPSVERVRERYTRLEHGRSTDGRDLWLNWVVRLPSGEAAGTTQATCMPDGTALIAYDVFPPFQHRGIATEAVRATLQHLKEAVGTKTARALVDTRNAPSIRLLERLGFERKRIIKDADHFKGTASDEYEYELRLTP